MVAAIDAVKGGESVLHAAKQFGVPRQTLCDRVSGKVVHGTNPGPKPFLTSVEEKELSNFIVDVAKAGYGKTRKQIMGLADSVAQDKRRMTGQKKITDGWFRRFMMRQSQLSLRKGDPTANVRMDCLNNETMDKYFDLLKDTLVENNLMESPNQIYNVDETGMPLNHSAPKIITRRGHKKVRYRTSGNKSQITVIGCVSATGHVIPPLEFTPHASTTESAKTPPTLEFTPHASTTESAKTLPTLEFTPHASTTESAKTLPTLEFTPHASTTESAKTPPTLEFTPHASTTESAKTCPTPVTTTPHTSAVGLAKTFPTISSSVHIKNPVTTPSSTPSSSGTSTGESDPELRYISKYLVQVISNATPKRSTSAAERVSGARVLTSAKCAAILEEREQKKKKEIEEKSKRKADREQKKKEKEEAATKKAEERARKAEEAAKKWENRTKKRTMQVPDTGTQA